MSNAGFVYAISNGRGAVKIGWSSDPWRRLRELNTHDAATCSLLGATPGTKEHEQEAHKLLSRWKIRGEWFDMTARPVLAFVMMLGKKILDDRTPASVVPPKVSLEIQSAIVPPERRVNIDLSVLRSKLGWSRSQLAEKLGVSYATIFRAEAGTQKPRGPVNALANGIAVAAGFDLSELQIMEAA